MTGLLKITELDFESSKAFYSCLPVNDQNNFSSHIKGTDI